jgi:transposase
MDSWKLECLEDYVKEHMSPKQFAAHVGISLNYAYEILQGNRWVQIPRPEDFEYPWPERLNVGSRSSFRRRQEEYVAAITEMRAKNLSKHEVAQRLGVAPQTIRNIANRLVEKGLIEA